MRNKYYVSIDVIRHAKKCGRLLIILRTGHLSAVIDTFVVESSMQETQAHMS
jgi:hypothetical protein